MSPRVIVAVKRTAYTRFVEEERDPRARSLIRRHDPTVKSWLGSHQEHQRTVRALEVALERIGAQVMWVKRARAMFDAEGADLVIAVGGDGTLLAASHSVGSVPILGVNSAPQHSVGFFCAARRRGLYGDLCRALEGELSSVTLTRMRVGVNGRVQARRVLNDALCAHRLPAATSRYILELGREREEQRSSGLWIGPAAGSTAAQRSAGGRVLPLSSSKLQLVVREPYLPEGKRCRLARRLLRRDQTLVVLSKMDDAMIWLDGPQRGIPVRLGDRVEFAVSDQPLTVLGLSRRRR